jgi:hypothetical protein
VGKPAGKRPLGRCRHRWDDNIKCIFKKWDEETWTGLIWLRIGPCDGRLRMRERTFGFYNNVRNFFTN